MQTKMRLSEDENLLKLCQLGNDEAWRALVAKYERLVYSVPLRNGLSRDEAADVFQSTFLSLYQQLDRISSERSIGRWLAVVAARETYRIKRLQQKVAQLENLDEQLIVDEDRAHQESQQLAQAHAVRAGLGRLADRCRMLLSRLYLDQASYQDVAAEMNMPVGTIGPTRARCLQKLKQLLDPTFFQD